MLAPFSKTFGIPCLTICRERKAVFMKDNIIKWIPKMNLRLSFIKSLISLLFLNRRIQDKYQKEHCIVFFPLYQWSPENETLKSAFFFIALLILSSQMTTFFIHSTKCKHFNIQTNGQIWGYIKDTVNCQQTNKYLTQKGNNRKRTEKFTKKERWVI